MATPKRQHLEYFRGYEGNALAGGAWKTSVNSLTWDIAGRCTNPATVTQRGAEELAPGFSTNHRYIDYRVPCRKCRECLKYRAWLWKHRAKLEILESRRTWFCTYTVRPECRLIFKIKAQRKGGGPEDFNRNLCNEIGKEFTKYLKRVRKQAKGKLRFCLVFEAHKDGFPHLHALIHEVDAAVTKAVLQGQWKHGFSTVKLCDTEASSYVTKYLSKSMLARVRASLRYGQRSDNIAMTPQGSGRETTTPLLSASRQGSRKRSEF